MNSRNPNPVKVASTPDTVWRNRSHFVTGRDEVQAFCEQKWSKEDEGRLIKEIFAFPKKIAVRYRYEYVDDETFNGTAHTGTRIGNLMNVASWRNIMEVACKFH